MKQSLFIVKTGSSFAATAARYGDFEQLIQAGYQSAAFAPASLVLEAEQLPPLPAVTQVAGAIITGSHAMVSEQAPWSERLIPWLQQLHAAGVPLLGICYGHQLLAHAFGGQVGYHPQGIEIGTRPVELLAAASNDPLFHSLPARFPAQLVHRQTVLTLPDEAICLARNEHEPHQAFRLGETCWGVQFHPEFTEPVMHSYIEQLAAELQNEGLHCKQLQAAITATPASSSLLLHFAELVSRRL